MKRGNLCTLFQRGNLEANGVNLKEADDCDFSRHELFDS